MSKVQTGLEQLLESPPSSLKDAKIGILANQASINSSYEHIADILGQFPGINLCVLFAPEHGFRGELQDMDSVEDSVDRYTGIKVRSLYGTSKDTLTPQSADLESIDILIVDLPDIGSRYYTFAQTMIYSMEAAAGTSTKILVLDRPNPINGASIEGTALHSSCRSFCGHLDTPNRHGMTLGELATMAKEGFSTECNKNEAIDCDLEVIRCKNWNRPEHLDETDLPWVYPSPNMPTLETAIIYPGSCLFEATEISEGRGTTRPLEQFGAPYIDGRVWAEKTLAEDISLKGAVLRPISFVPKFQKHAGKVCFGVQIHVTNRNSFQPVRWSLALLASAKRLYPDSFQWREKAFEFEDAIPAIDLLFGSSHFRKILEAGKSLDVIELELEKNKSKFRENRKPYLLY